MQCEVTRLQAEARMHMTQLREQLEAQEASVLELSELKKINDNLTHMLEDKNAQVPGHHGG